VVNAHNGGDGGRGMPRPLLAASSDRACMRYEPEAWICDDLGFSGHSLM
jgi:hypothetical protein